MTVICIHTVTSLVIHVHFFLLCMRHEGDLRPQNGGGGEGRGGGGEGDFRGGNGGGGEGRGEDGGGEGDGEGELYAASNANPTRFF